MRFGLGFWILVLGLRVEGLGLWVVGLGVGVLGSECGVEGLGLRRSRRQAHTAPHLLVVCGVQGCRVSCVVCRVQGAGCSL